MLAHLILQELLIGGLHVIRMVTEKGEGRKVSLDLSDIFDLGGSSFVYGWGRSFNDGLDKIIQLGCRDMLGSSFVYFQAHIQHLGDSLLFSS